MLLFQSTRPVRGATLSACRRLFPISISIHAPRAGRDAVGRRAARQRVDISIHAPRAGRDSGRWLRRCRRRNFNPRAPCGARREEEVTEDPAKIFQSTRPVRGATPTAPTPLLSRSYFNPRAPCGARPPPPSNEELAEEFQSTRPVRGATSGVQVLSCSMGFQSTRPVRGATANCIAIAAPALFQSTRPVRGATRPRHAGGRGPSISIHAPRAGRDGRPPAAAAAALYFNPRAPCGARPLIQLFNISHDVFQSTRPVRGATPGCRQRLDLSVEFQSTRPVRGATSGSTKMGWPSSHFNPRAPCGARRIVRTFCGVGSLAFQSTRPVRGATLWGVEVGLLMLKFQSTRPVRGATK